MGQNHFTFSFFKIWVHTDEVSLISCMDMSLTFEWVIVEAVLRFCGGYTQFHGGYTKSDQLLCDSQLELRFSWAVTT